ncbi:hypothetical protein ACOMHN_036371 [Nucella lapillus]
MRQETTENRITNRWAESPPGSGRRAARPIKRQCIRDMKDPLGPGLTEPQWQKYDRPSRTPLAPYAKQRLEAAVHAELCAPVSSHNDDTGGLRF